MKIGKEEVLILNCIRKNSRFGLTDIHRKTKIPLSTVFDKLNKLEKGLIKKYIAVADFSCFGFCMRVAFALKADRKKKEQLMDFLTESHNVNNLYRTNNGFDFFVEGIFRNLAEAEEFSDRLEDFKPKEKRIYHMIEDLKREEFLIE